MTQRDTRGGNYAAELQAPEVYRNRRARLAQRSESGTIVVWGSGDDRGYGDVGTFRQESSFFYLTGVELPNSVLVIRVAEGDEVLFLPPRNPNVERWTGPKYGPGEESEAALGFDQVLSTASSERVVDARTMSRLEKSWTTMSLLEVPLVDTYCQSERSTPCAQT